MLRSSITVTLITALGSVIGFLNQVVVARVFGASVYFDAYLLAISLPVLVSSIISSAFSYSLVPMLVRSMEVGPSYKATAAQIMLGVCLLACSLAVFGGLVSPVVVRLMGAGFAVEVQSEILYMARISWITAGLVVVTSFLIALQLAARRFAMPALVSVLPYLGMIIYGLGVGSTWGPIAIVWGMLIGYIASVSVLLARSRQDLDVLSGNLRGCSLLKDFFVHLPLVMLAVLTFSVHQFVDAYWAPRIGEASLSYLGYAQRLLVAIGTLLVAGPSAVLAPRITEALVKARPEQFFSDCLRVVKAVLIFGGFAAVVVGVLARPIIEILFQRGAFDHRATVGVASLLPLMMLGMTAMVSVVIMFRAIFAIPNISAGAVLGVLAAVLYFGLSGILSYSFGLLGIAAAYALSWWLVMFASFVFLWRGRIKSLISTENRIFVLQLAFTLGCVGIATVGGKMLVIQPLEVVGLFSLVMRAVGVGVAAVAVFYLLAIGLFRMRDMKFIVDFVWSKWLRSSSSTSPLSK
jgi:putative peptidoglycan lipid II flippase